MRHTDFVSIQEVIQQMRVQSPYKHKLAEATLIYAWKAAMPKVILKKTERAFFKQGKLFVQLSSAPLRQELQLNKDKVIELLKAHAQGCELTDVVFL